MAVAFPDNLTLNLKRISCSIAARKQTYQRKTWAWIKRSRLKFWHLGRAKYKIWILGCQRSGTTLLERIFRSDLDSVVFGEFSELTIDAKKTVWKSFQGVEDTINAQNSRYAVARPLFESDRAAEILHAFPDSIAVWVFRDPRYVVNSMINKWGEDFFQ